jgi:hypothetical protein
VLYRQEAWTKEKQENKNLTAREKGPQVKRLPIPFLKKGKSKQLKSETISGFIDTLETKLSNPY